MEKKKLGLSGKSKLELSKTVRGGTVRQSFSHGRVKSVAVEVKKVRTFDKNSSLQKQNERTNSSPDSITKNKSKDEVRNFLPENNKTKNKIFHLKILYIFFIILSLIIFFFTKLKQKVKHLRIWQKL